MKLLTAILATLSAGMLFAEKQPFSRYQPIIDRRPFGQPPPGYDPDSPVLDASAAAAEARTEEQIAQEQAQLQKTVSFSMMNINTDGSVSVGFSDMSTPSAPHHYHMRVGETRDGWLVKSVDTGKKLLALEKDGIEVTLELGASAKPADAKGGRGLRAGAGQPAPALRSALMGRPLQAGAPESYSTRRARREQAEAAAAKARAEQEAERRLRAEEDAAKAAEDKARQEEERAAMQQKLQAIQEELRARRAEEKARAREQESQDDGDDS